MLVVQQKSTNKNRNGKTCFIYNRKKERDEIRKAIKKYKPEGILILGTSDGMVDKIAENLGLPKISKKTIYIKDVATEEEIEKSKKNTCNRRKTCNTSSNI